MTQKEKEMKLPVWPVVWRLLKFAGKGQGWLYLAVAFDLILAAQLIISNDFMRRMFDSAMSHNAGGFWLYFWLSMGLGLLSWPSNYIKTYGLGRYSENTLFKLRSAVADKSRRLPVAYMEARHSGDMLSVLNADLGKLKNLLQNDLLNLMGNTIRGIAAFGYMLSIDWVLTLVATIFTPVIFIVIQSLTKPVTKKGEEVQEEIGQVNSVAKDGLAGAMIVKAFNLGETINERFHVANTRALKKGLGVARLRAIIDGVTFPLAMAPFILGMGLGGYFIFNGRLTFGALFAFINLLNWVVNPMGNVPQAMASIAEAAGAGRRVLELIDEPAERQTGTAFKPNGSIYAVRFSDVTFSYAGQEAPVLKNVSLDVIKGETVAVVGPSGSGKSTLVKLILGYYPMPDNAVEVLGHDENRWKLSAARDQMAFVAQDTYLFPVSIGENIALGKLGTGGSSGTFGSTATQEEIERAARAANIHDFIASLPQGYQTPVGEWGSRLSGGQKQRISLARAILKDAPILLLDEPTSALDTESEALVQQALDAFTAEKNRTTVVIAHRLSTIKNADRVIVIDGGQVVEQGTHDELLAKGGAYTELYQSQFGNNNGHSSASASGD